MAIACGGIRLHAALLAVGLLASCSKAPPTPNEALTAKADATSPAIDAVASRRSGNMTLRGALVFRPRIALPKQAIAIVELRSESSADGAVVAEQRIELGGKQVPIPFELMVERSTLTGKPPYQVRGGIALAGRPAYRTALVVIDETVDSVDLGMLLMSAVSTDGVKSTLRATGNEPGWRLELGVSSLKFTTADGNRSIEAPAPPPEALSPEHVVFRARIDERRMQIDVKQQVCNDTMTAMPHPQAVRIRFRGRTYAGCGGDPAALLQGSEWRVQDIDGALVPRSRATLSFSSEGRLTGRASCNAFGAEYSLTGERLAINRATATMMACEPALMQQERQFLDLLQRAERFEITAEGALVLHAAGQRSVTASRGL